MIACGEHEVSVHGADYLVLAQLGMIASDMAEELGKDRVLEACILGIYAKDKGQMEQIHDILKKGGMSV